MLNQDTNAAFSSLLLGATLAFWGWHTGLWWLGLPLSLLIILPRYLNVYWDLGLSERQRLADLCGLLTILAAGYLYFTQPNVGAVIILLMQWSPLLLFPIVATQLYGGRDNTELSALFRNLRDGRPGSQERIDLRPIYLIICLISTAMVPPPGNFYYLGLGFIAIWALIPLRTQNSSLWGWALALILSLGLGYGISAGLAQLQMQLEEYVVTGLASYFNSDTDPYRTVTAIGDIGRLKLSEQIVLRMWPDAPRTEPLLLQTASFTRYVNGTWLAERSAFKRLKRGINDTDWYLPNHNDAVTPPKHWVKIALELNQGRGLLPLPIGSDILTGLNAADLSGNRAGTVKVLEGPLLANYRVSYGTAEVENPPNEIDLRIPKPESQALQQVANTLKLPGLEVNQVLNRIQSLFQQQFNYSLELKPINAGSSAISDFLLHSHSGHCEYFASAAALLLRQAGIPARYVHGWSVQEYSEFEHAYIARSRHAHAWVLVWANGRWQDFDPTPPDWRNLEADASPWWETLQDYWSWLHYYIISQQDEQSTKHPWLVPILSILLALFIWRVVAHGRRTNKLKDTKTVTIKDPPTVFTAVERDLTTFYGARYPGETLRNWLLRLQRQDATKVAELMPALSLYYRQRFDPKGINTDDAEQLRRILESWLTTHKHNTI